MAYSQGQMIALGLVFIFLPAVFVILRVWARIVSRAGLSWDDYTIFAALAFAVATCICQLVAAINGQLGQHETVGPNGQPNLNDPRFLLYEKVKLALEIFMVLGLGFAKTSVCLLYMRIFSIRKFRLITQTILGIVITWTIALFFATLFQCYPITALIEPVYGNACFNVIAFDYAVSISDIILDATLLILPIPMVLGLQLPPKRKLAVLGMFLLGGLAVASSIIRMVVFFQTGDNLKHHSNDVTYYTSPVFFWSVIELCLANVSACLPTLRPIFTRHSTLARLPGSRKTSSYDSARSGYSRSHYGRSDPANDEFEVPVLGSMGAMGVLTHVQGRQPTSGSETHSDEPEDGVIVVRQKISSYNV